VRLRDLFLPTRMSFLPPCVMREARNLFCGFSRERVALKLEPFSASKRSF
jgi:hypothetical protein